MIMINRRYNIIPEDGKITVPSLVDEGTVIGIWEKSRKEIKERLLNIMGGIPEPCPCDMRTTYTVNENGYKRIHLTYASNDGDRVSAYLLKPDNLVSGKKYPAVIALHPTAPEGKDVSAGLCGKLGRQYGQELVKRGYIVLVPDVITAGERILPGSKDYETRIFYEKYPEWSVVGKMLYDHIQGVSLLESLPEVDSFNIGAIGHSLGGHNAFFLAAFDDRIKVAVSSCGLASIIGDSNVYRWSRSEWFVYFKSLKRYFDSGYSPFEFHEVISLIAPRAFFNWSVSDDEYFPMWEGICALKPRIEEVYKLYGAEENLEFIFGSGGHNFPDDIRNKAYEFLDSRLKAL